MSEHDVAQRANPAHYRKESTVPPKTRRPQWLCASFLLKTSIQLPI